MRTVVMVLSPCTTEWIDPFVFGDPERVGMFGRGQNTCCSQVDDIEGIHKQWIWRFS